MPELPEVEFARTCLERWLGGKVLVEASAPKTRILRGSSPQALAKLSGHRVEKVRRKGKWLVVELDHGLGLVGHLGMTGKLVHVAPGTPVKWSRAKFVAKDHTEVHFQDTRMFGRLLPGPLDKILAEEGYATLGPDAWAEPMSARELESRAGPRKRAIKDVLMDQTVLSGIGNIQATEALFHARIHPARPANSLSSKEYAALAKAIHWSLARTLKVNEGDESIIYVEEGGDNPFVVYGRAGEPCPRCGTELETIVIGGRSSAYCPKCQPKRPKKA